MNVRKIAAVAAMIGGLGMVGAGVAGAQPGVDWDPHNDHVQPGVSVPQYGPWHLNQYPPGFFG